jgi:hypothetical protein
MHFSLPQIVQAHDLSHRDEPFAMEEIEAIVKDMPTDRAPGLDGFNGIFMKKCWETIKGGFIKIVNDFCEENIQLDYINTPHITLIPKKSDPLDMNDYRPISMASLPLKFITKLMANRLQKDIIPILHQNQYGFIKTRNIQDCIAWAFEYLHICHLSKKPIIILKIALEKALDKVEYSAILAMLQAKGLGPKWISLVKFILYSATTFVLLNGVPRKKLPAEGGVRQCDPLSPLKFVNTSDLLQVVINDAWSRGVISLPIDEDFGKKNTQSCNMLMIL